MTGIDLPQTLTGVSLIIGASATLVIALRGKQNSDSNENDAKAIAVSDIKKTSDRVDILWEHIIDLREELDALRGEKEILEKNVAELRRQLDEETERHQETRRLLKEALVAIKIKDNRIKELEAKLKLGKQGETK